MISNSPAIMQARVFAVAIAAGCAASAAAGASVASLAASAGAVSPTAAGATSAVACSAGAQPAASTDRNSPATYLPLIRIETPLGEKNAPSCHCRPACVTGPGAAVRGAPSLRPQALPPATNNCTSLYRWACMPCTSLAPRGTKGSATGLCHCTGLNPIAPGGTIHEDF